MRTNEGTKYNASNTAGEQIGFCLILDERFNERVVDDDDGMGV